MNDKQIQAFIDVVDCGSFSKAEEHSYVSRQALKKQIDALEGELEFKLLMRSSKGIALTPVGKHFYDGAKELLGGFSSLVDKCRNAVSSEHVIKIGNPAHPRLVLENAFAEFSKQYPYIKQEVVFPDEASIINAVLDGTVDVAECMLPQNLDKHEIGSVTIAEMTYKCLVSERHPLAGKSEILPEELSGQVIGLRRRGNMELIQKLKTECRNLTLVETAGKEMHNLFTFCYNHGIFISRAYYATKLDSVVAIPLKTDLKAECCIIFKKRHSAIVGKFISVVRALYPIQV